MIDIDHLERRIKYRDEDEPLLPPSPEEVLALIAEIRRLRGKRKEHRKCPCGGGVIAYSVDDNHHWIYCSGCMAATNEFKTLEEAWDAWDGVEG